MTLLQRRAGHHIALRFAERAIEQGFLPVIDVSEQLMLDALARFRRSPGMDFSFTDCTSFSVMEREGIRTAFAFDYDFAKAGFNLA